MINTVNFLLLIGLFVFLRIVVNGISCDTSDEERLLLNENSLSNKKVSSNFQVVTGKLYFNKGSIGNPNGKYGILEFPTPARPFGFNAYCKKMGKKLNMVDREQKLCGMNFALGPSDAVVWLGCTPPKSEYFSLAVCLSLRFKPKMWGSQAQFGDAINQLVVNTTSYDKKNPFCKTALFVSTADAETFELIRDAYVEAGFPEKAINAYAIPEELVHFKHGIWYFNKYDLFAWQFRVNGVKQKEAADEYFSTNQTVYLLQKFSGMDFNLGFGKPPQPKKPMPIPPLRTREDGTSEFEMHSQALGSLISSVQQHFEDDGYSLVYSYELQHKTPNITRCMVDPDYSPALPPQAKELYNISFSGCDWFTRDALYSFSPDDVSLEFSTMTASRVFVLVGLNQVLMGKCTHYNLLFSSGEFGQFESPDHGFYISNNDADGSATRYGKYIPSVDKMMVWKFGRPGFCKHKENKWCTEITDEQIPGLTYIAERKYLNPASKVGASPYEVIPSTILVFESNEKKIEVQANKMLVK